MLRSRNLHHAAVDGSRGFRHQVVAGNHRPPGEIETDERPLNRRFLGVDYGRRRTGISLCDPEGKLAWPVDTLSFRGLDDLAARLAERARAEEAAGIVLGLPRRLDGSPGDLEPEVEDLAARLRARGHTVILWNEQLTTWEATEVLQHAPGGVRRRKGIVDAVAAAILLQSYLESL